VRVYHLTPWHYQSQYGQSRFWTDEDVYPSPPPPAEDGVLTLDRQAEYILSRVPDARFIVRLNTYAPKAWMDKNPGELQTDGDGKTYEPSWASQKYLDGIRGHYTNLVHWVEAQPWGDRVLGYFVLPYGEGGTILSISGHFFDHSAAMQRAWHEWLQQEYSSDAALQAAWGDDKVLRATTPIPDDATLRAKIEAQPTWPDPAAFRRERDYVRLQQELFARYVQALTRPIKAAAGRNVLVALDAMKQPMLGWQHNEAFFGEGRNMSSFSIFAASGSLGVGPLLDLPSLDGLVTPADYTARGMGFAPESEGLSDSLVLRGKSIFVENDTRTWLAKETRQDKTPPLGSFLTPQEVRAGLLRNSGQVLSRGLFTYWMDISNGFYNDPAIQREVQLDKGVLTRGASWPHRETQHAIALIIDDESPLYGDYTTGFNQLAVLRQRIEGLALTGIPYRIYLLSDLKKDNFPDYRCYLFPNLFKVDDEVLALLKRKVFRDGHIAIFGPGTAITLARTNSARGAERVLGIPMKLHEGVSSRRVRLMPGAPALQGATQLLYGDSYAYGPILAPDRAKLATANTQVLGELVSSWQVNAPGLVLKEFGRGAAGNGNKSTRGVGDYAVVFSAAMPLPSSLLRSLARYGGCNLWAEEGTVVSASDSIVSLHTTVSGPHTIHLPRRYAKIIDGTTGRLLLRNADEIRLKTSAPETRVYFLE
jgi:hypothetical protein